MFLYKAVQRFYDVMGFRRPAKPTLISSARRAELMAYLMSEVIEFGDATDLLAQVDAATDLLFFVMDVFVEMGVPPEYPFSAVFKANMGKLWPDGKPRLDYSRVPPRLLRPDGWQNPEPRIQRYLELLQNGE